MSDGKYGGRKGQKNFRTKDSHANKTMQIGRSGRPLAGLADDIDEEENTYVTTNNVVNVDFIEGEYEN